MADKRISQLVDRGTVVNNDVVPIVVSGAVTTNKATISSIQTFMQGNLDLGVTSVGITLGSSGTDVSVTGSPITTSGNITINIPDASASARGVVNTGNQTFAGIKTFNSTIVAGQEVQLAAAGTASTTFVKNISGSGLTSIGSNGFGFNNADNIYFSGSNKGGGILAFSNTGNQTYTLQNASGTLAFTSDLTGFVTLNTAQTITAQKTFTTSGGADTLIVDHTSGSGIALDIAKAGNGEGLRVAKSSGSGNAVTITGGLLSAEAATLTGALNGTSAVFSGAVSGTTITASMPSGNSALIVQNSSLSGKNWSFLPNSNAGETDLLLFYEGASAGTRLTIASTGAATFSSSVTALNATFKNQGSSPNNTLFIQTSDFAGGSSGSVLRLGHVATTGNSTAIIQNLTLGGTGTGNISFPEGNVGIGTATPQTTLSIETSGVQNTVSPIITSQSSGTTYTGMYSIRDGAGDQRGLIFQNFTANVGLTEKMRITSAGNVGIGTATPAATNLLHVAGNAMVGNAVAATNLNLNINGVVNKAARLQFMESGSIIWLLGNGAASENGRFEIFDNINGTGVQLLRGATSWTSLSDERFKDIIEPITVLDKLKNVRAVVGKYKTDEEGIRRNFVIAQDLLDVFPEVVDVDEDKEKPMGVRYTDLIPILIASIQELKTEIDSLKNQIK